MYPLSNNSLTMDNVNWPYLEKILNPSKLYKISATTEHRCSQKLWSDNGKTISLSIIDVGPAWSKLCTELVSSFVLKGTNLTWRIGQWITPILFKPSNWSKWEQNSTLKSGTSYLPAFHKYSTDQWMNWQRNHNTTRWLFTVLILGRSIDGIFKQCVKKSILLVQRRLSGTAFLIIWTQRTYFLPPLY